MVGASQIQARQKRQAVMILCEGFKTEPNYLGALVREIGLTAVSIPRDHETDPKNLAHRAIRELKAKPDLAAAYVVFDRDRHANYNAAVRLIENHPLFNNRLFMIRSQPCFELWLLLHFEKCRAPMSSAQAFARLRHIMPEYNKGDVSCMEAFISKIDLALDNADFAWIDAIETGEFNPSTEMQKLIRYLRG